MENVDPSFSGNQTDQADHGESPILASRENLAPHILKTQMATNYNLQCQEVFSSNQGGPFQVPFKENLTSVNSVSYQDESSGQICQQ